MSFLAKSMIGKKFGRLTVLYSLGSESGFEKILCYCSCGNFSEQRTLNVYKGNTRSCGCLTKDYLKKSTRHGHTEKNHVGKKYSKLYIIWNNIKTRSHNGKVGEPLYEGWNNFLIFLKDVEPVPENARFTRIDKEKGFSPDNCEWRQIKKK